MDRLRILRAAPLAAWLALGLLAALPGLANAGSREQAKRMHDRLVGVPPSAAAILPPARSLAPVNAPFSCPKSSLSTSSSGIAAQLMGMNGPARRSERS